MTTPADPTLPSEPSNLLLFPGNSSLSVLWNASPTTSATYQVTVDILNPDGSTFATLPIVNTPYVFHQFVASDGVTNSMTHRVTVQSVSPGGVLSVGIVGAASPIA